MNYPNNPKKAFLAGKRDGTVITMNLVSHVLLDKCGFVRGDVNSPENPQNSIAYLFSKMAELAAEINEGRVKLKDIQGAMLDENNIQIVFK